MAGGRSASEVNKLSTELNAAAKYDGFSGVDSPVFVEHTGVASSQLQLGKCALRPVIMHYRTEQNGDIDITSYSFEGTAYTEVPHAKQLDSHVSDRGMLELSFQNSAELQTMTGEDVCRALEPVLATRNLQAS